MRWHLRMHFRPSTSKHSISPFGSLLCFLLLLLLLLAAAAAAAAAAVAIDYGLFVLHRCGGLSLSTYICESFSWTFMA